ncbi:tetratricopeptide repeat protein [Streptomyces sp. bgisy027]|uniref:tetratricopeptide repeat protein n=1 Tax=Streptomyces sp. bgisy027 TaxID=3413770 RepID=UPI003D743805
MSLLDAFDVPLATRAAGLAHEGPAQRLTERPFVRETPFGLWPFQLHGLIRSAVRNAEDTTDDRWTDGDWQQAARRAFTALGEQHQAAPGPDRLLLIAFLRQGLRLARDHRLDLGWLTPAAWTYVGDSVWEPLAPPDTGSAGLDTAADALVELLSALARRQHQHRSRTVARLTTVIDSHLLPDDLHHMALYYRAKAHRDLGDSPASRAGMQAVADGQGRLAPAARRGLAHLARMAGDFPTALATAHTLGWEGRHHRVEGDIWWPHGAMDRAAAAYAAARDEAEHHGVTGERGNSQAHRAFALAFTDPAVRQGRRLNVRCPSGGRTPAVRPRAVPCENSAESPQPTARN